MKRKRDERSDSFNDRSSPNKEAEEQKVAPYEPRVFPLSDEEYNKMMAQETPMAPPHPVAGPSLETSIVSAATSRTNSRASSVLAVSKYDHLPWGKLAGMLLEVNLTNFMCHEKYRFEPNQRLNFLTGENGSGKSAVLTAIVFGLGGTARTSNRGSSNKVTSFQRNQPLSSKIPAAAVEMPGNSLPIVGIEFGFEVESNAGSGREWLGEVSTNNLSLAVRKSPSSKESKLMGVEQTCQPEPASQTCQPEQTCQPTRNRK